MNRREFLKAAGFAGAAGVALTACAPGDAKVLEHRPEINLTPLEKTLYPAKRNVRYKIDSKVSPEAVVAKYNNYYEFSEVKEDVAHHARALPTREWKLEVEGLVNKPQTDADIINFQTIGAGPELRAAYNLPRWYGVRIGFSY